MNWELNEISFWFKANKLSLNSIKIKYSLFHSASKNRILRKSLPFLNIDNIVIERENVIRFFRILIVKTAYGNST